MLRVESLEARDVPATFFKIDSLATTGSNVTDHNAFTGDDRGGIAVSTSQVFVTGDAPLFPPGSGGTARFNLDLSGGTNLPATTYDALTMNLRNQRVYTLGTSAIAPLPFGGGVVTHLIEIDGATGALTATSIPLSQNVPVGFSTGIFAGYDRVVLHPLNGGVFEIDLRPGFVGAVTNLVPGNGSLPSGNFQPSESWAYWGVAEHFGGQDYLDYAEAVVIPGAPVTQITRHRVQDNQFSALANFSDLSDMASFTVNPGNNRWYFHYQGTGQFNQFPSMETLGYANATLIGPEFVVTNTNNSGPGSLRQAVQNANDTPGVQTIIWDGAAANGTINLGNSPIPFSEPVILDGPGSNLVIITGNPGNSLFQNTSGFDDTLTMDGLRLQNTSGLTVIAHIVSNGDLIVSAGSSSLVFANTLEVASGQTTLTAGGQVDAAGTTIVDGTLTAANGIFVGIEESLGGNGTVNGAITADGSVSGSLTINGPVTIQSTGHLIPGASPGTITINGNLVVQNGGMIDLELDGPGLGQFDRLIVNGEVNLGTHANFEINLNYAPGPGDSFLLITNDGADPIIGLLNGIPNGSGLTIGGNLFQVRYDAPGGTGNDLLIVANSAPVLNTAVDTTLFPILEDVPPADNPGTTVDALVATGGLYSDAEGVPPWGVAVVGVSAGGGTWQFSLNAGGSWTNLGTPSVSSARLLKADGAGQNRIRFLPNGDFFGTATMSFKAWDTVNGLGDGSVGNATVNGGTTSYSAATETATIQVLAVNDSPVAANDSYSVAEDNTLTVPVDDGVLDNDTDVDGEFPLTAKVVDGPAHGQLTLNANGSFTYTPAPNYFGPDSFTYKVSDGDEAFDVGVVNITVTPTNDNPDAVNDNVFVPEDGGPLTFNVLTNDTAAPDSGETLTITAKTDPSHGTVEIAPGGGSVIYTPAADYYGPDSFTYTISDGNGGTDTATVNVTVTSVNDDPDAVNDTADVDEDQGPQEIPVLANDSFAPDLGETLKITTASNGLHGKVVVAPDGFSLTYEPDQDYAGPDTFLYTIDDGNGGSDVASVTVNVVNDHNDRLEVVTSAGMGKFTEGGGPVLVDSGILIGTGLEGVLTSATVKFSAGYVKKKDVLLFPTFTGALGQIKGKFSSGTGTLTLKGVGYPQDYEEALRTVQYTNNSPAPVDGIRTIAITVQDSAGTGTAGIKLLEVEGVNTKPVVTPGTAPAKNYTKRGKGLAVAGTLKITDLDNTRLQGATVAITGGFVAGDELNVTVKANSGISFQYNSATGVLTLSGNATLKAYLAALKSLKFTAPLTTSPGTRTLSITVSDGDKTSDSVTRFVNVL
jgi:hypothetical protein